MKITTKLWIGLAMLVLLSPIGLILPEHFKAGAAWGEWSIDEMRELVGYIPQGLEKLARVWSAPIPDYAFKGWEGKPLASLSFAYIASALIGILACVAAVFLLGKFLTRKNK